MHKSNHTCFCFKLCEAYKFTKNIKEDFGKKKNLIAWLCFAVPFPELFDVFSRKHDFSNIK